MSVPQPTAETARLVKTLSALPPVTSFDQESKELTIPQSHKVVCDANLHMTVTAFFERVLTASGDSSLEFYLKEKGGLNISSTDWANSNETINGA